MAALDSPTTLDHPSPTLRREIGIAGATLMGLGSIVGDDAITNLAALRMHDAERLYARGISWLGLLSCLFLAFWVERIIWMVGLGLIVGGLAWWMIPKRLIHC